MLAFISKDLKLIKGVNFSYLYSLLYYVYSFYCVNFVIFCNASPVFNFIVYFIYGLKLSLNGDVFVFLHLFYGMCF